MIEEQSMHKVMCDGCGRTTYQELAPDVDIPRGLTGTVVDNTGGGTKADWFAHTQRCIGKAVQNAITRRELERLMEPSRD